MMSSLHVSTIEKQRELEGTVGRICSSYLGNLSYIYLGYFVCVCVCVCVTICCGTFSYSFSFNNQTDQGDETEGLEGEGLEMER